MALPASLSAKEIPESFPQDIVIADYMVPKSVMDVRGNFRINLHARSKTVGEIAGWFKAEMAKQGWTLDEKHNVSETDATLPFTKDGRICAIVVTSAVLNVAGKMDHSTRGITIQTAMKPAAPRPVKVKK
ncbi:MAG: hypothetical protein GY720_08940 [bacterium]|nr:hypothetical protein [bacterium]